MKRRSVLSLVLVALALTAAAPAFAGIGLHAGASVDPDDFLIGLHFMRRNAVGDRVNIVPGIDVGFGDAFMLAGNLDGHFILAPESKLRPYVGAGLTVNWVDYEGGDSTDLGGSILGGIQITQMFYFETKYGLGDVPEWKFILGLRR